MTISEQHINKAWIYATLIILLIPVALVIVHMQSDNNIFITALLDPSCDLHQTECQSQFPNNGKISLAISPRPIRGLKPLQIQVQTDGIEAQSVMVDFRGLGMDMGYNRPQLNKISAGHFSGTWVLASCALERMAWEATVLIRTNKGIMAAPFRFEIIR